MRPLMRHGPLIFLLVLLAGCVSRIDDGTEVHIRYEYWVPLLQYGVGAVAIIAGLKIKLFRRRFILIGLLLIALLVPMSALQGVWVTDDRLVVRSGSWWNLENADLRFEDIGSIRDHVKPPPQFTRNPSGRPYLQIQLTNGDIVEFPVGSSVMSKGREEIYRRWKSRQ